MEPDDLYDEQPDDDRGEPRENRDIRQLRQKAKEADTLKAENSKIANERDSAKRELAMVRAGIDLDSPTGKLFAKAYDGETSVEAVKTAAAEYGLIEVHTPSEEELSQQQALQRLASAGQGASAPGAANSAISPDVYASWDSTKRRLFLREHPTAAEALKRGQSVPAIAGF